MTMPASAAVPGAFTSGSGQTKSSIWISAPSAPITRDDPYFDALKPWVDRVLDRLLEAPGPALINVNFPARPTGIHWTHQSVRHYDGKIIPATDPMGREHFWFTVMPIEQVEENSDRWAVSRGLISMTPLTLDLTDHRELARLRTDPAADCNDA